MPEEVVKAEKLVDKDAQKTKGQKKTKTFLNKIIIRKLPPNLTSDQFLEMVSPLESTDYYFVKADWSLGAEATSRAYIEFKNQEDIFIFKEKFDEYVFLDSTKGTEYPAIVEYAPFQGLPKSRARKKDKHVGTIDNEQHFLNFLDMLKKAEENDGQKTEPKLEYSYQIKDDKKITKTPLLEFLSSLKEEKREAKKKKIEDKKKQRDEEKQKKKQQTVKNIPELIKESNKEEIVYDDGIMVRTVPSRLGRNDKSAKKDSKVENKSDKDALEKEKREKRDKEREDRKKIQREKEEKRKHDRDQQRAKERDAQKAPKISAEKKPETPQNATDDTQKSSQQPKREVKRYSELRKARQEKNDSKESTETNEDNTKSFEKDEGQQDTSEKNVTNQSIKDSKEDSKFKRIQELRDKRAKQKEERKNDKAKLNETKQDKSTKTVKVESNEPEKCESDIVKNDIKTAKENKDELRWKRIQELREKRQRERDERAQRQIRNKDRPSMQIYRPKRCSESKSEGNGKSSDENSESNRKREIKSDERKLSRRDSRDERNRRKKNSRKSSSEIENDNQVDDQSECQIECAAKSSNIDDENVSEKMEQLSLAPVSNEIEDF